MNGSEICHNTTIILNSSSHSNISIDKYFIDEGCDYETFNNILMVTLTVSLICLIFIISVCFILPEFKTLHGTILITLSTCLAFLYALSFTGIFISDLPYISDYLKTCSIIGILSRIAFIATHFWTNVMTFDICRAICRKVPKSKLGHRKHTYLYYSVYAWIGTLISTMITIYTDLTIKAERTFDINSDFDLGDCTFDTVFSSLAYIIWIITILLVSNLVMLILTVWTLARIRKQTKMLELNSNRYSLLYVKLFFIMGVIWTTGYASFFPTLCAVHMCTEIINSLHGMFLFIAFMCKRTIFLKFRDCWRRNFSNRTLREDSQLTSSKMISER